MNVSVPHVCQSLAIGNKYKEILVIDLAVFSQVLSEVSVVVVA